MNTPTCKDKLSDINFKYSNWKTDQQNVRCSSHSKQICKCYCIDCNTFICAFCFQKSHQHHKYEELWEACSDKFLDIKSRRKELCNDLLMIEDQLDTLARAKNTIKTNHDVRRRQILQQDQQLKYSLKTHAEDLIVDLDNKYLEQEMLSVKRRRKSRIQRTQVRKHKSYHSEYFTIS